MILESGVATEGKASQLASRRRIHEMVAETLRGAIQSGALSSGAILSPGAIADVFKVSRVPILRALATLEQAGLVARRLSRGFVVAGDAGAELVLSEADIRKIVPNATKEAVKHRTWRDRIYPDLERDVAGRLLFGHFQIRSQALAKHYGVSRTVANELMVGLERVGIVRRETNARWYAGPLTRDHIVELFEMRILLEPAALQQAAEVTTMAELHVMEKRVATAIRQGGKCPPLLLHQLEIDLHHGVVLRCTNSQMREILYRCQLPLITSHLAFDVKQDRPEVPPMLESHAEILTAMLDRDVGAAASALAAHLEQSRTEASARVLRVPKPAGQLPPYMMLI